MATGSDRLRIRDHCRLDFSLGIRARYHHRNCFVGMPSGLNLTLGTLFQARGGAYVGVSNVLIAIIQLNGASHTGTAR